MPTAYLSPSQLRELTDVSVNPGSGQNGYPLVWNNSAGKWEASLLPYSSLSGAPALPIPVASGGTGTQTGSITGTGALTFTAGGDNQNITVSPSGEDGFLICTGRGFSVEKPGVNGFFKADGQFNAASNSYRPSFTGRANSTDSSLAFRGLQASANNNSTTGVDYSGGVVSFVVANNQNNGTINSSHTAFAFYNFNNLLIEILGRGDLRVFSTTASNSTSTGALQVSGGAGIAGNLYVGGQRVNLANLPTNTTGLSAGDLWRDGDVVKVKT